jgi:hypothetical protein
MVVIDLTPSTLHQTGLPRRDRRVSLVGDYDGSRLNTTGTRHVDDNTLVGFALFE